MSSFANQIIWITGAGSGIGRQLALNFAAESAAIAALDRNAETLETLAKELDGKPFASVVADVTNPDQMRRAVKQIEQQLGPVDLLIASAGVGFETSALNFRAEDMATLIGVNLLGVANSIEAVLPGMMKRKAGHVVAISSLASYRGMPMMAGYCASKAGVNSMMEGLRVELRGHNIFFTTVCPGWILTPMTANLRIPIPDMMTVEDAAKQIMEAIRRRRTFYAFPPQLVRRLSMLRWLPLGISDWLVARMLGKLKKG